MSDGKARDLSKAARDPWPSERDRSNEARDPSRHAGARAGTSRDADAARRPGPGPRWLRRRRGGARRTRSVGPWSGRRLAGRPRRNGARSASRYRRAIALLEAQRAEERRRTRRWTGRGLAGGFGRSSRRGRLAAGLGEGLAVMLSIVVFGLGAATVLTRQHDRTGVRTWQVETSPGFEAGSVATPSVPARGAAR